MSSINKVLLIGSLGQDPEIRTTPSGQQVATLNVATNEKWKDANGQKQERTEWTRVIFWGRLADVASKYLEKGARVYIEGSLSTRKYTDKNGVEKYSTEVKGRELVMLGGSQKRNPPAQDSNLSKNSSASFADDDIDDIPF